MGWLLLFAWAWPLLLAGPAALAGQRSGIRSDADPRPAMDGAWLLPALGPLPALVAALLVPLDSRLELPWLFLGTTLGMDALTRVYLSFTALLWLVAGIYTAFADRGGAHAGRFNLLFLLAMAGNLWLIVGQDLFSFYAGFAIMGVSSYGLVIHDGHPAALRAGKVYLVMALFGEVCLFASLVLIANRTGTSLPSAADLTAIDGPTIALLLLGLGVKAGMVPLHVWLPLAHPAAPIPASAVLSGTMIKTALLGWMRFLPVGALALPGWGDLLAGLGLMTLLFALPIGLVQSDPKVLLAYSSISKMGLMLLVLGLALIEPALAPIAVAGIAFYAASHALVKGGLFLGVGLRKHAAAQPPIVQALVLGALVFLALSLAGAPLTSGAVAKYALKPVLTASDWTWIGALVGVATFGTTLLMVRFVWVAFRTEPHPAPGYRWPGLAWGLLIGLVLLSPFRFGDPTAWMTNLVVVPLALNLGLLMLLVALLRPKLLAPWVDRIPPGDILVLWTPLQRLGRNAYERFARRWQAGRAALDRHAADALRPVLALPGRDPEHGLRQWPVAGGVWVGISALLLLAVLLGQTAVPISTLTSQPAPPPSPAPGLDTASTAMPSVIDDPGSASERPTEIVGGVDPPSLANAGHTPAAASTAPRPEAVRTAEHIPDLAAEPIGTPPGPGEERNRPKPPEPSDAAAVAVTTPAEAGAEPSADVVHAGALSRADAAKATAPAATATAVTAPAPESTPASVCDPPATYLFAPEGIIAEPLALARCDASDRPLRAPALSGTLVERVQQALKRHGYDPGPADGLVGPRTRAAVRSLQRDNGLTADATLTFEVLDLLQTAPETVD